MLIQFTVSNFLSFKQKVKFSMVAHTPIKEHEGDGQSQNVFYAPEKKLKILKSSVLYGANSSGKSNLLAALEFFKDFILNSSNNKQASDEIPVKKFLFSTEVDESPSAFEMVFYIGDIRYRYGFEADQHRIHAEWLFALNSAKQTKESQLFVREFQQISINKAAFKEGKGIEDNTRPNALFLSTVAQLNGERATTILGWFASHFNVLPDTYTQGYTINRMQLDSEFRNAMVAFFLYLQFGIEGFEVIEGVDMFDQVLVKTPAHLSNEMQQLITALKSLQQKTLEANSKQTGTLKINPLVNTIRSKFDENRQVVQQMNVPFDIESNGTKKLFSLFGPIFDTIKNGKILVVDELDARLHTLLTLELVKFFHMQSNEKAQLIFASHDTNLLKKDVFRRDQIWFTEKDNVGATDLYSLVEYKINQATVRNDASFEKDYLLGKYGAIPFLGDIQKFKAEFLNEYQTQEA